MSRYIDAEKVLIDNAELADCDFNHPKYEETLRDIIDNAPTADVKPVVHGKWIEHIVRDDFDDAECVSYECNECHSSYAEDGLNFCPNCGCQMDGEQL